MTEFGQRIGQGGNRDILAGAVKNIRSVEVGIKDGVTAAERLVGSVLNPPFNTPDGQPLKTRMFGPGEVVIPIQRSPTSGGESSSSGNGLKHPDNSTQLGAESAPRNPIKKMKGARDRFL